MGKFILKLATFFLMCAAVSQASAIDFCGPKINGNYDAQTICPKVCAEKGGKFLGNWSNERNHPPVQACIHSNKGESVCGCSGDVCTSSISSNADARTTCGRVCEKENMKWNGNWSNKASHPPVEACSKANNGKAVCGCVSKNETVSIQDPACDPIDQLTASIKDTQRIIDGFGTQPRPKDVDRANNLKKQLAADTEKLNALKKKCGK